MGAKQSDSISVAEVKSRAHGRWPEILVAHGIDKGFLSGKPSPCPMCFGTDRFQFTDERRGCWICRKCADLSHGFPDGFNLIAAYRQIDNFAAIKLVAEYIGLSTNKKMVGRQFKKKYPLIQDIQSQLHKEEILLSKKQIGTKHADAILKICIHNQHQYLTDKGIYNNDNLVIQRNYHVTKTQIIYPGALIIPIFDIANINQSISAQFINNDKTRGYISGSSTDGIHILTGNENSKYVGVVEGFATGQSVRMITEAPVIVTFDANGMKGKASRLQSLFPNKSLIFFGDNDSNKQNTGQNAAHAGAALTNGFAVIPAEPGDWDDYRQKYGVDKSKIEIELQLEEFRQPININEKVTGVSINHSILLSSGKAVSFSDALIHHTDEKCICPISNGKAVINAGTIYSFELRKQLVPIISSLHDQNITKEIQSKSLRDKLKYLTESEIDSQKRIYAFVSSCSYRLGTDIPNHHLFNSWLYKKTKMEASPAILSFIECLVESRMNQAKKLTELNVEKFQHHQRLIQHDGQLNWEHGIQEAISGKYQLVIVKAHHGQGKTQCFIKIVSKYARKSGSVVYVAHRAKLVTQACNTLDYFHYADDRDIFSFTSIVPELACCLHSFKHDIFISHLKNAHAIFIDEASQVKKTLFTDQNIQPELPEKFAAAIKGSIVYLLDADITTDDIRQYQQILNVQDNDVLVITAEPPDRNFTAKITCSSSPRHYQTSVINSITDDLGNNIPCVLAVESELTARGIYEKLSNEYSDKSIVLFTGKFLTGTNISLTGNTLGEQSTYFINHIESETESIDLFIHTSVIGTGVSIQHDNKRFKKGYALFCGLVLSATEGLQMMRRFRDINEWEIGIWCRPADMYMTSYYDDIGSKELDKSGVRKNKITQQIQFNTNKNKALFPSALLRLLRDDYGFFITGQLATEVKVNDLMSNHKIREIDELALINAIPCSLKHALLTREKNSYTNIDEQISVEAALCLEYFKITKVTIDAAEIWCNFTKKEASKRLELIVKSIRCDESINDVESINNILIKSGITLELIKNQRLTQAAVSELRDMITSQCGKLVGLGFLPERYCKASKIPSKRPIVFISEFLTFIGFNIKTKETRVHDRERQIEISIPPPMASRLCLDTRSNKQKLREHALSLHTQGLNAKTIGKELGITTKKARLLIK